MDLLDLVVGVFKCNHMYYIKNFFSIHFLVHACFLVNIFYIVLCFTFKWPKAMRKVETKNM